MQPFNMQASIVHTTPAEAATMCTVSHTYATHTTSMMHYAANCTYDRIACCCNDASSRFNLERSILCAARLTAGVLNASMTIRQPLPLLTHARQALNMQASIAHRVGREPRANQRTGRVQGMGGPAPRRGGTARQFKQLLPDKQRHTPDTQQINTDYSRCVRQSSRTTQQIQRGGRRMKCGQACKNAHMHAGLDQ